MRTFASKLAATSFLLLGRTPWFVATMLRAVPGGKDRERGDVPGWVMITLMSALLVAGLLALATPALERLFNEAMTKVGN